MKRPNRAPASYSEGQMAQLGFLPFCIAICMSPLGFTVDV